MDIVIAWNTVTNEALPTPVRTEALFTLIYEEDGHRVAAFVAQGLLADGLDRWWCETLILAAEEIQTDDTQIQQDLLLGLWRSIERPDITDSVLWCALRRFASMAPVADAVRLIALLDDRRDALTVQAVFQAIQTVFVGELLGEPREAIAALREAVWAFWTRSTLPVRAELSGLHADAILDILRMNGLLASAALDDRRVLDLAHETWGRPVLQILRSRLVAALERSDPAQPAPSQRALLSELASKLGTHT